MAYAFLLIKSHALKYDNGYVSGHCSETAAPRYSSDAEVF